jgi:hypothetical protein
MNRRAISWLGLLLIAMLVTACGVDAPPTGLATDHYDHKISETTEAMLRLANWLTLATITGLSAALLCDIMRHGL